MDCPRCGKTLRDGTRFCTVCGFATAGRGVETETDRPRPTAPAGASAAAAPLAGRVLDSKYELVERLGEGGMGAVYRARRLHIGDEVAVKVLNERALLDASSAERFRREARSAASIGHPNVVTIHDFSEARPGGEPAYIVMELVRGPSLRSLLKREGRLDAGRAVALMRDICAGVGLAHRRGVVHRDLKPDNVIVAPPAIEGEREVAKVVDFGIAKLRDLDSQFTLTQTGAVVGTPFYMSPEQCRGASLDARSDVYSLGAMLYEMLAGAPPFRAGNLAELVARHLGEPPPPFPPELRVSPALEAVCLRALSKRPEERPADATELSRELRDAAVGAPDHLSQLPTAPRAYTAAPPSAAPPAARRARPLWWALAGLLLLATFGVMAAAAVWYLKSAGGDSARDAAREAGGSVTPTPAGGPAGVGREVAATPPPPAVDAGSGGAASPPGPLKLGGEWEGGYGPLGTRTSLAIKEGAGGEFTGVLTQGAVRVAFTGSVNASTRRVTFKETRVLSGGDWNLGENTGTLSGDGKTMTGTGTDAMSAQLGLTYSWSFSRR